MSEAATDIFDPPDPRVPSDWQVLDFADAVSTISDQGRRVKKRDYKLEGNYPVLDQGQDFIGGYTSDEAMLYEGELPVIIFGDHTLAVKYMDKPFAVGADGVKLLRPNGISDPKYLYYLLQSLRIPSRGYSRHFQFLRRFKFPVAPEEQQPRIVAEIEKQFSRLDEAVASLKRVKANLKRYKAAVLKAAVEGKLTEEWRKQNPDVEPASKLLERILAERRTKWAEATRAEMKAKGKEPKNDKWKEKYKGAIPLDTENLPDVPESWTFASLDELGQEGRPIIYGIIKPGPHDQNGVPYVRVTEMKTGEIDVKSLRRASPERAAKFSRALLKAGDILISKDGTIGKVAIVPAEAEGANITQHVMRAPTNPQINNQFVAWSIRAPFYQRWLEGETKGVALRGVNVEDFRRLPIPVPGIEEQNEIVREIDFRLSVIQKSEANCDLQLARISSMRQGILSAAFQGKFSYITAMFA